MNNNRFNILLFILIMLLSKHSIAVTVDAGDYTRLPDGTNLAVLYMQQTQGTDLYIKGDKADENAELNANVGIFRLVHFMDIAGLTIAPQFLLPFGEINTGGSFAEIDSTNGIGDLIINPTIHFMQDPERKKALAFTPWLYLPTGQYDSENGINAFGENRWKLALQLGYITPLSEKFTLDILGDVMFFGENDDYTSASLTLKQAPLFEAQTHLRYHLSNTTHIAGLISYSSGGETEVAGIKQDNAQKRSKTLLTLGHFFTPVWQVLASYGQDISLDEGVAESSRFNLRLLRVF